MESDSTYSSIALAISVAIFALAALSEAAISSVSSKKAQTLVSDRKNGADWLIRLQTMPLGSVAGAKALLSLSMLSALLSTVALVNAQANWGWGLIVAATLVILIVLGLVHRAAQMVASLHGTGIALGLAAPIGLFSYLLFPILLLGNSIDQRVKRLLPDLPHQTDEELAEDLALSLDSAGEALEEHELRMIKGVFRLDKTIAREIMIPRVDMIVAEVDDNVSDLGEKMIAENHSRIPVFIGNLDHIEGIVYARDIIRQLIEGEESSSMTVESVVRPALFIPESKTLEELLNEFQEMRVHMAIVVDEYGGVSGLVTIEDLLEEIVGEIQDEFDVGEPEIESLSDREFIVDARIGIDELNDLMAVSVEGDGYDTLGGFVYERLGKIPSPGDTLSYDGVKIEVISTVGRRLKKVKVTKSQVPPD